MERRRRDDRKLKGEDRRRQTPPSALSLGHPTLRLQAGLIWSCYCDYRGSARAEEGWTDCSFLAVSGPLRSECEAFFWNELFSFKEKKKGETANEGEEPPKDKSCH